MRGAAYAARDQEPGEKSHLITPQDRSVSEWFDRPIRAEKITTPQQSA
jgi:hypothetical protein